MVLNRAQFNQLEIQKGRIPTDQSWNSHQKFRASNQWNALSGEMRRPLASSQHRSLGKTIENSGHNGKTHYIAKKVGAPFQMPGVGAVGKVPHHTKPPIHHNYLSEQDFVGIRMGAGMRVGHADYLAYIREAGYTPPSEWKETEIHVHRSAHGLKTLGQGKSEEEHSAEVGGRNAIHLKPHLIVKAKKASGLAEGQVKTGGPDPRPPPHREHGRPIRPPKQFTNGGGGYKIPERQYEEPTSGLAGGGHGYRLPEHLNPVNAFGELSSTLF